MVRVERTASEWFAEAARCYTEHHQGCAWCGGSHRVFQTNRNHRQEFSCSGCDFRAGFDAQADAYYWIPGEDVSIKQTETMFEI